jgi:hypothetical protein
MSPFDLSQLDQFTGTEHYYRLTRRCLLTDGAKYLADAAAAYWLLDEIAIQLQVIGTRDWFVLVHVQAHDNHALISYIDGNCHEYARQEIPYTDFPMASVKLYACWDSEHWVLMLPSEY